MKLAYYKRFRMEIDLAGRELAIPATPGHYAFVPWHESLLDAFARAKFLSFRNEIDTNVFPCLAEFEGCRRLMRAIIEKPGFLPETTWLVVYSDDERKRQEYCGTVQGVRDRHGVGTIQNFGITKHHRRRGLGLSLLLRSLAGFRRSDVRRVTLEVTAQNAAAIRLYRRVGFNPIRIVYKTVEPAYSP